MTEIGVVLGKKGVLYWHLPPGRNLCYLPDSRDLWEVFWSNRDLVDGFAHSHPGGGEPAPSWEDITTFAAVEQGLGRRLNWWIISKDAVVLALWTGPGKYDYEVLLEKAESIPEWVRDLREASY